MDWDCIKDNWKLFHGKAKQQWNLLTDSQLEEISGNRKLLAASIELTYGISKHAAEWQLSGWQQRQLLPKS